MEGTLISILVVAEKPSVAMSYAKVLGATNRQDGYLEGNGYLVSWCVGHLVELAPPNVYDAKYVKWSIADLPILPERWQYLVSASTKKQFGILQKLMHRPDVDWCCTIKVDIENSKGQYIEKDKQEATKDGSESTKIQHGI